MEFQEQQQNAQWKQLQKCNIIFAQFLETQGPITVVISAQNQMENGSNIVDMGIFSH